MDKQCPFWTEQHQCASRQCGIAFCDDEVPAGLREPKTVRGPSSNSTREANESRTKIQEADCDRQEESNAFDPMDRSLEDRQREQLTEMDIHDWGSENFCEIDGKLYYFLTISKISTMMHFANVLKGKLN